jgi:hypothetical protein
MWEQKTISQTPKDFIGNYLNFQSLLVTWCTNSLTFNNYTLCPHCIYVFCIYLRTNSDFCHLQHKLIGFYNRDLKFLQRGTDWAFIWSSPRFVFKWFIVLLLKTKLSIKELKTRNLCLQSVNVNLKSQLTSGLILVNNQIDARFFFLYIYSKTLHVSNTTVLIIRKINYINTTSDICHSM